MSEVLNRHIVKKVVCYRRRNEYCFVRTRASATDIEISIVDLPYDGNGVRLLKLLDRFAGLPDTHLTR